MKQVFLHAPSLKTCVDKLFIFAICHTSSLNEIQEFPLDRILWLHKMDLWRGGTTPPLWSLALSHSTRIFIETDFENSISISVLGQISRRGGRREKITLEMDAINSLHCLHCKALLTVLTQLFGAKGLICLNLQNGFHFLCFRRVSAGWVEWDRIIPL